MSGELIAEFENNPGYEKVVVDLEEGQTTAYISSGGQRLYVALRGHIVCFSGLLWDTFGPKELKSALNFAIDVALVWRREAERIRNGGVIFIICKECNIPLQKHPFTGKYTCFVHGKR